MEIASAVELNKNDLFRTVQLSRVALYRDRGVVTPYSYDQCDHTSRVLSGGKLLKYDRSECDDVFMQVGAESPRLYGVWLKHCHIIRVMYLGDRDSLTSHVLHQIMGHYGEEGVGWRLDEVKEIMASRHFKHLSNQPAKGIIQRWCEWWVS